jgi:hypothetical protein
VLCAFGAVGIAAKAASLQGFDPSAGWGAPSPDFSTCGVPGSLGVSPPWDIPLPDPWPRGCHERPDGRPATTPNAAFTDTVAAAPARPPLAFREGTLCGHRTLCFKFQRTGKLACLARGRRSLEVFVLVPGEPGLRTSRSFLPRFSPFGYYAENAALILPPGVLRPGFRYDLMGCLTQALFNHETDPVSVGPAMCRASTINL